MEPADRKRDIADMLLASPQAGRGPLGGQEAPNPVVIQMMELMRQQQEQMMQLLATAAGAPAAPPGLEAPQPPGKVAKTEPVPTATAGVNAGQPASGSDHSKNEGKFAECISPTQEWSPPQAKGVPASVAKAIDKAARDFERDVKKWIKGQDLVKSESEALAEMSKAKSEGKMRYPPGTRPSKALASSPPWTTSWTCAREPTPPSWSTSPRAPLAERRSPGSTSSRR